MGSVAKSVTKTVSKGVGKLGREVGRVGRQVGDEFGRAYDNVENAVSGVYHGTGMDKAWESTGAKVGREVKNATNKVGSEMHRAWNSNAMNMVPGVALLKFGLTAAKHGANSKDIFNSFQDSLTGGLTNMGDQWLGKNAESFRQTVGYIGAAATSFIPVVGVGVAAAMVGVEQARHGAVQKQEGKAEAKEQEAAAAEAEAKQTKLNQQAQFIEGIYSMGEEQVASNAYYDTYRQYGNKNKRNKATYGVY